MACPPTCIDVDGNDDAFAGLVITKSGGRTRSAGRSNPPPDGQGTRNVSLPDVTVIRVMKPTCTGNGPDGGDDLCQAAVTTCAADGEVRLWVFTREENRLTGATTPWARVEDPPFVCRGAQDPEVVAAVDPAVLIAAIVQRDFERVVVLKGVAEVSPRPDTLVNIPTRFTTDAPASYDIPLTLLGQAVTITATARSWTWHFGDGASATTTAAGTQGRIEHVYRNAAPLGAHVVIEWSGTYRIGAGPTLPITGTATTTGNPTAIAVKEARSQLVDASS